MPRLLAVIRARKHLAGGHDQEDHGNWATGGTPKYESGKWQEMSDPTSHENHIIYKVVDAMDKLPQFAGKGMRGEIYKKMLKLYNSARNSGRVIANGNIQVRLPERPKFSDEKIAQVQAAVDRALSFVPKDMLGNPKFPIEINLGKLTAPGEAGRWTSSAVTGVRESSGGIIQIKGEVFKGKWDQTILEYQAEYGGAAADTFQADAGKEARAFDYVVAHEIGHAAANFISGSHDQSDYTRNIFRGFTGDIPDYENGSKPEFISDYAQENSNERYAEHFAAYVFGQSDPLTDYLAKESGWERGDRK